MIRIRHLALPALALALAAPAVAQDTTTVVRLRATYEVGNLSGFVVLPFAGGGDLAAAAAESAEIVRRDLDFSDQFKLAKATGARAGEPVNVALWRERGADWVLTGTLAPRAGGSTLRLTLHDAVYGQTKGEGSFDLPPAGDGRFRMAVHAAADAVVRWATGEPGIAATRIAFVTQGAAPKEIYLVDSDGENVTRVTSDGSLALSPAWSPDGGRIAYTSYRGGMPALYERNPGQRRGPRPVQPRGAQHHPVVRAGRAHRRLRGHGGGTRRSPPSARPASASRPRGGARTRSPRRSRRTARASPSSPTGWASRRST